MTETAQACTDGQSVQTFDLLTSLGFVEDPEVMSDDFCGLTRDFGDCRLSASFFVNRWFQPVVLLHGIWQTPRRITQIETEMPRETESWEQGVAWVTYCLDSHADGEFTPLHTIPWLPAGRAHRHLLPWERQRAAWELQRAVYEARPRCSVRREWARLALKELAELAAAAGDETLVTLSFDGEVVTIRCEGRVIAAPAEGAAWRTAYAVQAAKLRNLPKRLSDRIEISMFEGALSIGRLRCSDVVELDLKPAPQPGDQ